MSVRKKLNCKITSTKTTSRINPKMSIDGLCLISMLIFCHIELTTSADGKQTRRSDLTNPTTSEISLQCSKSHIEVYVNSPEPSTFCIRLLLGWKWTKNDAQVKCLSYDNETLITLYNDYEFSGLLQALENHYGLYWVDLNRGSDRNYGTTGLKYFGPNFVDFYADSFYISSIVMRIVGSPAASDTWFLINAICRLSRIK